MARTTFKEKKIISAYQKSLEPYLRLDGVFVFGSTARGERTSSSDLDVIVLSRDFKKMSFMRRLRLLNRLRSGPALHVPMDIIGFTPDEFKSLKTSESPNLRRVYHEAKKM